MNFLDHILPDPDKYQHEALAASGGIYYVVRLPTRWEVFPFRFDEFGDDILHQEAWVDHVVPILAGQWSRHLRLRLAALEEDLLPLDVGFPRGRIEPAGLGYRHLHGDNLATTGLTLARAERPFGLGAAVTRLVDQHEMCRSYDRDLLCGLLQLGVTWPAVDTVAFG